MLIIVSTKRKKYLLSALLVQENDKAGDYLNKAHQQVTADVTK
jgi:hypothetical protein